LTAEQGQAFVSSLVTSHGAQLRRFLTTRVRNAADVPDLVQEVFLRMLRIPDHEAIRSPEAYLFTVAQHVAHQHAITASKAPLPVEIEKMLTELQEAPPDPLAEMSAQESLEALERALHRLTPRERATFVFHRRDGLTLQAIAERLGVSRHSVKKYMARALIELRAQLSDPIHD
jgi:RNA polymerase sigma factor (sigma-70 family)